MPGSHYFVFFFSVLFYLVSLSLFTQFRSFFLCVLFSSRQLKHWLLLSPASFLPRPGDSAPFLMLDKPTRKITFDPDLGKTGSYLCPVSSIRIPKTRYIYRHLAKVFYEQPRFDYIHIIGPWISWERTYDEYITHLFEKSINIVKKGPLPSAFYGLQQTIILKTETRSYDDYVE